MVSSQTISGMGTGSVADANGENYVSLMTITPAAILTDTEQSDSEKGDESKDKDKEKDKEKDHS